MIMSKRKRMIAFIKRDFLYPFLFLFYFFCGILVTRSARLYIEKREARSWNRLYVPRIFRAILVLVNTSFL